ncbi:MAG: DUF523 domain-containing protein [Candidatus Hadarchaeia archaeon]
MTKKSLVSACLLGINCKYDESNNKDPKVERKTRENDLIPVCPEQLGGLETPRDPMILSGGDGGAVLDGKGEVRTENGKNVTKKMIKGARETLKIARIFKAKRAILKAKSPSCGFGEIYQKDEGLTSGNGVTAELLHRNGIELKTEQDF